MCYVSQGTRLPLEQEDFENKYGIESPRTRHGLQITKMLCVQNTPCSDVIVCVRKCKHVTQKPAPNQNAKQIHFIISFKLGGENENP